MCAGVRLDSGTLYRELDTMPPTTAKPGKRAPSECPFYVADGMTALPIQTAQRGFTLIELVVVLLLVGVLMAVGMPRFFNQLTFLEWGFSDELGEALRFGQKLAVATGCDTQVTITAGGYQLNQRVNCSSGAFTLPVQLPGSDGTGYQGAAPGGVTLAATTLYFDTLGRPRDSSSGNLLTASTSVTVGSRSLTVEPQTGYVH